MPRSQIILTKKEETPPPFFAVGPKRVGKYYLYNLFQMVNNNLTFIGPTINLTPGDVDTDFSVEIKDDDGAPKIAFRVRYREGIKVIRK